MSQWTLILVGLCLGWPAMYGFGMMTGFRMGRERARFDLEVAAADRQIAENRAPRHARTQPRISPGEHQMISGRTGPVQQRTPWVTFPGKASHVTAADLAPVFWAQPGTRVPGHPQAGRDSMDGTMVGGVAPVTTDTGEFRAIATAHTDRWIEDMRRSEAAFRGELLA